MDQNTSKDPLEHAPEEEGVMGFWDHVEELRWTLVKSLVVFSICFGLVLAVSVIFSDLLQWPLHRAFDLLGDPDREITLRTNGPSNVFSFLLQLGFFGGFGLSLPFMLYFFVRFVAPGLTKEEKAVLRPVCLAIVGLFLAGVFMAFFLLLPLYLYMSLVFEAKYNFVALWTPGDYYGAVVYMSLGLGLLFQSPLVIILLIYLGIVDVKTLSAGRRYAAFFILVIAALLTPGGDPITLAVAAAPLYVLYEIALAVGGKLRLRKELLEEAAANRDWDEE